MAVYYNENDPFAAAWLCELIKEKLIADGDVDTRSICDVAPGDLAGFTQHHFFAGIGGWSYALRLAGWPDDRPAWTGSCPCQPFSAAGKRQGVADKRHLWPDMCRLVAECQPATVFGEQVASKDGRAWLSRVRADLEALGYAVGAADICAAGVGAPHIRQRLYWMAHAERNPGDPRRVANEPRESDGAPSAGAHFKPGRCRDVGGLANTNGGVASDGNLQRSGEHGQQPQDGCVGDGLEHAPRDGREQRRPASGERGTERGCWADSIFILCADGKSRRVPANEAGELEPALFPLAHGVPNRVGTLRGAGNAIVPQVAAEFVRAYLGDCTFS